MLMDVLKIKTWLAVIGGSLGGMQAMEWSVLYPDCVKSSVIIAASLKLSAQNIAFNEIARRSIQSDENFNNGDYLNLASHHPKGLRWPEWSATSLSLGRYTGREIWKVIEK